MRYYFVPFLPTAASDFDRRVKSLQMPTEMVHTWINTADGQSTAIYITERTAREFPQFIAEFPGGKWLDQEP